MSKIIYELDVECDCDLLDESGNFCHMVYQHRCEGNLKDRPDFCPLKEVSDE